jgi:hypothetical protein
MTEIDRRRRFVFRGNAAAFGGRIVHPEDVVVESSIASSLTVAGGRSHARNASPLAFGKYVRIAQAETRSEGLFDDLAGHVALTRRKVTADTLTTSTSVHAEVSGVVVGAGDPVLTVKQLRGGLGAKSSPASGEPAIPVADETAIRGVEIGGFRLNVKLALRVFQECETYSKLMMALDAPKRRADVEHHLLLKSAIHGDVPTHGRLLQSQGTIYATIVKSIEWANKKYPGSTITDHVVHVPGFGKLVFGEILISNLSRRLTMLRLELGSPQKGDLAFAEVETNGIWT